ncbi:MAG: DMT family transporter [Bryobacterales bacterium]|nr:DMT family transporter [Bryobacteraceae bacterium]MDW8354856.1 DMT family transporter [Bryobacterales bacterium]
MNAPPVDRVWGADAALVGITLIWGATFVLVKHALEDASTLLFLALRFTLASVALAAGLRWRGVLRFEREGLRAGLVAGACLFCGYLFQTIGLRYTTPSKSAFITGLSVVLVPLLGAAAGRVRPRWSDWGGACLATCGLALLTLEGASLRMGYGDLLTLVCAFGFALHILVVGYYAPRVRVEELSLVQIATAAALALAGCWWAERAWIRWSPRVLGAVAVTGLLATALAFTVQAWAQRRTTPTRTALIFALEPVFAWLTAYLVAGEVFSAPVAAGAGLILAAILLVELGPAHRRQRRP